MRSAPSPPRPGARSSPSSPRRRRPPRRRPEASERDMAETTEQTGAIPRRQQPPRGRPKTRIGIVTANKMQKTVVVTVRRRARAPASTARSMTPAREVQGARRGSRLPEDRSPSTRATRCASPRRGRPRRTSAGGWSRCSSAATARASEETDAMIQMTSVLDVADNSGAKKVFCIKVLGGSQAQVRLASATSSSSRSARRCPTRKVKKGDVAKAVIVRTKREVGAPRRQLHQVRRQLAPCSSTRTSSPSGPASSARSPASSAPGSS